MDTAMLVLRRGDRVRLINVLMPSGVGEHDRGAEWNPLWNETRIAGTVTQVGTNGAYNIEVLWDNGLSAWYVEHNLELLNRESPTIETCKLDLVREVMTENEHVFPPEIVEPIIETIRSLKVQATSGTLRRRRGKKNGKKSRSKRSSRAG